MNRKNRYLMYSIALLQGLCFYAPVATLYRQARGISILQMSIIEGISFALCMACEIPWGIIADRIGYKKTMITCCLLYFISKIIFWQAHDFIGFLCERILLSVVIAGLSGVDESILYLCCKTEESTKVFGIYQYMGTIGLILAELTFSMIIKGNQNMAAFLTIISYGGAAFLSLFLKPVNEKQPLLRNRHFKVLLKEILGNKSFCMLLIAAVFLNETYQYATVFLGQLQYVKCGINEQLFGYLSLLLTIGGISSIGAGALKDKLGTKVMVLLICLMELVACLGLAFTKNGIISVSGLFVIVCAHGLFGPVLSNIQNVQISRGNRATVLSMYAMIMDSIAIVTDFAFGAVAMTSISNAFLLGMLLCMAAGVLFIICYKK